MPAGFGDGSGRSTSEIATGADGDDLSAVAEVDAGNGDGGAEHLRLERKLDVLLEHREPAGGLLGIIVGVDRGLLDHFREPGLAESGWRPGSTGWRSVPC